MIDINQTEKIRFKTSMLRSALCDYSDAYIVVKGMITVTDPDNDAYDKGLTLKNNAPFVSCLSKINNTLIDNAEDLDIVMPMYNLLEYSKNYGKTTGSFWNYYRDEPNKESTGGGNGVIKYWIWDSKSFDYKANIVGTLQDNNTDMPLINCEINLILAWSENCVLTSKATRDKVNDTGTDESPQFSEINQQMQHLK